MKGSLKNKVKLFSLSAGVVLGIGVFWAVPITGVAYHQSNENTLTEYMESESFTEMRDQKIDEVEQSFKNDEITYEESVEKINHLNSKEFADESLKTKSEGYVKSKNIENDLLITTYVETGLVAAVWLGAIADLMMTCLKYSKVQSANDHASKELAELAECLKYNTIKSGNEDETNDNDENNVEQQ